MRFSWLLIPLLGVLAAVACGRSEPEPSETVGEIPELVPRRVLLEPDHTSVRLSPDGDRLAYLRGSERELVLASADAPTEGRVVEVVGEGAIEVVGWVGDERLLYERCEAAGNRRLFVLDVGSGRSQALTPEGSHAEVVAEARPPEIVVALNLRNPRWPELYRIDVATGERQRVEENDRFVGFAIDQDGDVRLAFEETRAGDLRVLQRAEEGEWVDLFRPDIAAAGRNAFLGFDRSAEVAYFSSVENGTSLVEALRLTSGESRVLFREPAAEVAQVLIDPRNRVVQAVATTGPGWRWSILDESMRADFDYLGSLTDGGGVEVLDRSDDDRRWLVALTAESGARSYRLLDRDKGEAAFLFDERGGLDGVALADRRPETIDLGAGRSVAAHLSLPPEMDGNGDGRPAVPLPTVVLAGGDQAPGDRAFEQWLTNRGYAALAVDLVSDVPARAASADESLAATARWAVDEGIADSERIAAVGFGYGGFATLSTLGRSPETFACAASLAGPTDLTAWIEALPAHAVPARRRLIAAVGDPETEAGRRRLATLSPKAHAKAVRSPVLVVHGDRDPWATPEAVAGWVKEAAEGGAAATHVVFPGEGAKLAHPASRLAFAALTETWLSACLGGRAEPMRDELALARTEIPLGAEHLAASAEPVAHP